jgi:hypothetical protein
VYKNVGNIVDVNKSLEIIKKKENLNHEEKEK